jgi:hypothetical protein
MERCWHGDVIRNPLLNALPMEWVQDSEASCTKTHTQCIRVRTTAASSTVCEFCRQETRPAGYSEGSERGSAGQQSRAERSVEHAHRQIRLHSIAFCSAHTHPHRARRCFEDPTAATQCAASAKARPVAGGRAASVRTRGVHLAVSWTWWRTGAWCLDQR